MIMALISIGRSSIGTSLPDSIFGDDEVFMLVLAIDVTFGGAFRGPRIPSNLMTLQA